MKEKNIKKRKTRNAKRKERQRDNKEERKEMYVEKDKWENQRKGNRKGKNIH